MGVSLINNSMSLKVLVSEDQKLASSLNQYTTEEIYRILGARSQNNTLSECLYNAIASFLCKDLSSLSSEQLIKVTEIYVKVNSTHSIFNKLFDLYEQHASISLEEIVSLLVICQELESAEVKQPPNQVLVDFLRKLKSIMLNLLKANESFLQEMRLKLKNEKYSEEATAAVLDALLNLGAIYNEKPQLLKKCCQLAQSKYAKRYDHSVELYLNIYILQARFLAKTTPVIKKEFYESDPLYKSNRSKIQCSVNDIHLEDIATLVKKSVAGRLRDSSLFRTFSKRIFVLLNKDPLNLDQARLLIGIIEGYARLNIHMPSLFDLCYRKIVCHKIELNAGDALRLLHGSAIYGLIGSPKCQVKDVIISVSPYICKLSCESDLIKLALMVSFVKAFAPAVTTFGLNEINISKRPALGESSAEQQEISDYLTENGIRNQCEGFIDDHPNPLDIIIRKSDNPQLKCDTIIEVDGPYHLDISGQKYLGKDIIKNYNLSKNWTVKRLILSDFSYYESNELMYNKAKLHDRLNSLIKEICY